MTTHTLLILGIAFGALFILSAVGAFIGETVHDNGGLLGGVTACGASGFYVGGAAGALVAAFVGGISYVILTAIYGEESPARDWTQASPAEIHRILLEAHRCGSGARVCARHAIPAALFNAWVDAYRAKRCARIGRTAL